MSVTIRYHDKVETADGRSLGVAQRIYHYDGDDYLEMDGFRHYLKTFDFESGDDFYIPLEYVAGRDDATGTVTLSIKFRVIQTKTFSRAPRAIAYRIAQAEDLSV